MNTSSPEPLVSILIPTYNRPEYLQTDLKSAIQQTYRNIEIVVSDNCSPENPQSIVEFFQDSRVRFQRNATNIGLIANMVGVAKMARGKYIAYLQDDDIWEEDFLEKLVPPLEANPDLALVFCDHYIMNSDGKIDYPATEKSSRRWKRDQLKEGIYQPFCQIGLVHQAVSSGAAAVIRKDVVDWNNIPLEVGGLLDLYITYLCCRSGRGAYYYPERLSRYRVHPLSDTMLRDKKDIQTNVQKAKNQIFCFERFMEDERLEELMPYFKQKWAQANTTLGIALMRGKRILEARSYFLRALKHNLNIRTIAALILSYTPQSFASRF